MTEHYAKVSADLLKNAPFFFDSSLRSIFGELLQNARRAGATSIEIALETQSPKSTRVTVLDNGHGIKDFGSLIHLGLKSGWGESSECPAGMGIYSLCKTGGTVQVSSGNSRADLTEAVFKGEAPLQEHKASEDGTEYPFVAGTGLRFSVDYAVHEVETCVTRLSKYYPAAVRLNGKLLPSEDFLGDAVCVDTSVPGVRLGLFDNQKKLIYRVTQDEPDRAVNFFGLGVRLPKEGPTNYWTNGLLAFSGRYYVLADVTSVENLDFVLPNRDIVVGNQKLAYLKDKATALLYSHLAACPGAHAYSFDVYQDAKSKGFDIGEPEFWRDLLKPATFSGSQPVVDHNYGEAEFIEDHIIPEKKRKTDWPTSVRDAVESGYEMVLLPDLDEAAKENMALAGAMSNRSEQKVYFVSENNKYRGYSWYPSRTAETVVYRFPNGITAEVYNQKENEGLEDKVEGLNPDMLVLDEEKRLILELRACQLVFLTDHRWFTNAKGNLEAFWLDVEEMVVLNSASCDEDSSDDEIEQELWSCRQEFLKYFEGELATLEYSVTAALDDRSIYHKIRKYMLEKGLTTLTLKGGISGMTTTLHCNTTTND